MESAALSSLRTAIGKQIHMYWDMRRQEEAEQQQEEAGRLQEEEEQQQEEEEEHQQEEEQHEGEGQDKVCKQEMEQRKSLAEDQKVACPVCGSACSVGSAGEAFRALPSFKDCPKCSVLGRTQIPIHLQREMTAAVAAVAAAQEAAAAPSVPAAPPAAAAVAALEEDAAEEGSGEIHTPRRTRHRRDRAQQRRRKMPKTANWRVVAHLWRGTWRSFYKHVRRVVRAQAQQYGRHHALQFQSRVVERADVEIF